MLEPMPQDQFAKGLATILNAIQTGLSERGVVGAVVEHAVNQATPPLATFTVTLDGRTENASFAGGEIDDCGEAIDAPAALKVRMLVSHFVR
jgi:hypothetical protein